MEELLNPVLRTTDGIVLTGTMAIYDSQAEASERIPQQWRAFLLRRPFASDSTFYGASPCTGDRKIHYLIGVAKEPSETATDGQSLVLEAGEYAVVQLSDPTLLRDTWVWLLRTWLPASGRRERNAPEFERFTGISDAGTPIGSVEIWVPLEPDAHD